MLRVLFGCSHVFFVNNPVESGPAENNGKLEAYEVSFVNQHHRTAPYRAPAAVASAPCQLEKSQGPVARLEVNHLV